MNIATHDGTVIAVSPNQVKVKIVAVSACGHCDAKGKCGFAESNEKEIEVATSRWEDFNVGDAVEVQVDESLGFIAVIIAYLLPAALLITSVVLCNRWGLAEWLNILIALAVVTLCYVLIYLFRNKLQKRFSFNVAHKA